MEEKLTLSPEGGIALSRKCAEKLITEPDGNAARLYLLLALEGGCTETEAAVRLGLPVSAVRGALAALTRAGLSGGAEPPVTVAEPTSEDASQRKVQDPYFSYLVSYAEQTLGRNLTASDLRALLRICDRYGLQQETVPILLLYCAEKVDPEGKSGRRPNFYQIEKAAAEWEREGIDTPEKADVFVRERNAVGERVRAFLRGQNVFSAPAAVQRTVEGWLASGLPEEVLTLACELTVTKTGAMKWNYADSIVRSWLAKGLHTVEEIRREDHPTVRKPAPGGEDRELERQKELLRRSLERANGANGGEAQ